MPMNRFARILSAAAALALLALPALALPPPADPNDGPALVAAEPPPSLADLRHAVLCPPFTGEEPLARLYHDTIVKLLKESHNVCVLEASSLKKPPVFHYRVDGSVSLRPDGSPTVTVRLVDVARGDVLADYSAPASADKSRLAAWCRVVRKDIKRRVRHIPFECDAHRQLGQDSLTLDRGADAGLLPNMILYISERSEPILDHNTGKIIGRDTPRTFGQVKVFRVLDRTAYVRPVPGTAIPRRAKLFVRSF
jgi:hypothetical protein